MMLPLPAPGLTPLRPSRLDRLEYARDGVKQRLSQWADPTDMHRLARHWVWLDAEIARLKAEGGKA